ncbi:MAG: hypothetical protein ACKVOP_14365 [Sphingomonadaceae bacterium]
MRLTAEEITAIKAAAAQVFGPDAIVRLFGSRIRDDLKGGDIDLHVEVLPGQQDYRHIGDFKWELFRHIEEQKVDLVPFVRGRKPRAIDEIAFGEGIIL